MTWRIDQQLLRGEIDARSPGRVTGRLWLVGLDQPVDLDLVGEARPDVAGHFLQVANENPGAGHLPQLVPLQRGLLHELTASVKVLVPGADRRANAFRLAWESADAGQVVIESVTCRVSIASGESPVTGSAAAALEAEAAADAPTSAAEARAEAERSRQELLLDRVQARIERAEAAGEEPDFERILDEERLRLRRERGELDPDGFDSFDADEDSEDARVAWIEELNAAAEDALAELEAEERAAPQAEHPLVRRCHELGLRVHRALCEHGWAVESDSDEHPLLMLDQGVMFASGKLAGALNPRPGPDDWPPESLFAGDVLVRLKKARAHLRDALAGLDAAEEQNLADPAWRATLRAELVSVRAEVDRLVAEVRAVLETDAEGSD